MRSPKPHAAALPHPHFADVLLRDRDLGGHGLDGVDLRDEIAGLHQLADALTQPGRDHDSPVRGGDPGARNLLLEMPALGFRVREVFAHGGDLLRPAPRDQHPGAGLLALELVRQRADLLRGRFLLLARDRLVVFARRPPAASIDWYSGNANAVVPRGLHGDRRRGLPGKGDSGMGRGYRFPRGERRSRRPAL